MRNLLLGLMSAPFLATGCVVHSHHASAQQPVYASAVRTPYSWQHVRWCVWTEYYGCTDEEVYYLERAGYDDDDALVMCHIARQARVPVRSVAYEYDRCGRSLYAAALVFRLDPSVFYCREVPRDFSCPGPYGRAYGSYWRGERPYLSNDECRALVHLQIGVRYYGYSSATYFREYDRCRSRNEHPFRTVVVRDYSRCGSGGRTVEEKVVVKKDRPWDHPTPKDWEKKREIEREKVKLICTPQKEKEEIEKARQAAETPERKIHVEKVRVEVNVLKAKRDDDDKKHAFEGKRDDGPKTFPGPDRRPEATPVKPATADARKHEGRNTEPRPLPSRPAEARKPDPVPAPVKRASEDRKPAEPRKVEERRPAPEPPKRVEQRRPAPSPPPKKVEQRRPAPAPEKKSAEPRKSEGNRGGDSKKPEGRKK